MGTRLIQSELSLDNCATKGDNYKPREECGVFAVHNYHGPGSAAIVAYLGLLALQHRGQESAGIAYNEGDTVRFIRGMGLVDKVFSRQVLDGIRAANMIGHVRYSTTGSSVAENVQPLVARSYNRSGIAVAHNGNLTNTRRLHNRLLDEGQIFHTTSDTELLLAFLFRYRKQGLVSAVRETMKRVQGAYAAVAMAGDRIVAFRDPHGFRPLVVGEKEGAHFIASETAALDTVGADFLREIEPGEIVSLSPEGLKTYSSGLKAARTLCIFEHVYFARPDSVIDGRSVHLVRKEVGANLAKRIKTSIDIVVPSPDSGVSAAMGLAEELGKPLEWAVYRNPYLGRTFINPSAGGREQAVRLKFNPMPAVLKGKSVAIVDDSLVRGTTARVLSRLLRQAGASEVHLCIASPPYRHPCYYGIDIPRSSDLAAPEKSEHLIAREIGADSLLFARPGDLYCAVGGLKRGYCTACFTGNYPTSR